MTVSAESCFFIDGVFAQGINHWERAYSKRTITVCMCKWWINHHFQKNQTRLYGGISEKHLHNTLSLTRTLHPASISCLCCTMLIFPIQISCQCQLVNFFHYWFVLRKSVCFMTVCRKLLQPRVNSHTHGRPPGSGHLKFSPFPLRAARHFLSRTLYICFLMQPSCTEFVHISAKSPISSESVALDACVIEFAQVRHHRLSQKVGL